MVAVRTAEAHWEGSLFEGQGEVELVSSGLGSFEVSWPARAEQPNGKTSPEELIAAAHSTCFSMQLSGHLTRGGNPPTSLDTRADVTFDPPNITGVKLTVQGGGTRGDRGAVRGGGSGRQGELPGFQGTYRYDDHRRGDARKLRFCSQAASVGNRAPPHGEGASGGALPLRATTTAVDSPRDAQAALKLRRFRRLGLGRWVTGATLAEVAEPENLSVTDVPDGAVVAPQLSDT